MSFYDGDVDFIRKYFEAERWSKLSECEKKRYANIKRNYEVLKSAGIHPQLPEFMRPKKSLAEIVNESISAITVNKGVREEVPEDTTANKAYSAVENSKNEEVMKTKISSQEEMINRILNEEGGSRTVQLSADVMHTASLLLKGTQHNLGKLIKILLAGKDESDNETQLDLEMPARRYPKRSVARKCYIEEDLSSEDDFLFCDDCETDYNGDCPIHGPLLLVNNRKVPRGSAGNYALHTLPSFLSVCRSGIKGAGLGVWTEIPLPKGIVFGPYQGVVVRNHDDAQKSGYAWQIRKGGRTYYYLEGSNSSISNWLRYVNCAECEEHQNLIAFQYKGNIYYRTYKEVKPYTELLVWYGDKYAIELGIDLKERPAEQPKGVWGSYECNVCHALFASEDIMIRHRRRHPHMKPDLRHRCPYCSYSTSCASHLNTHLITHSNKKMHECQQCGRAFSLEKYLRSHLLIHTEEKKFKCIECSKRFRWKYVLDIHLRTHSKIRPFICSICGKAFSFKSSLNRHGMIHSGQKPHKCQHCDYRTNQSVCLHRHINRKHTKK